MTRHLRFPNILIWAAVGVFIVYIPMKAPSIIAPTLSVQLENENFTDTFDRSGLLEEASLPNESTDPNWWLNSGGKLIKFAGAGHTIQGELAPDDPWRREYAETNPVDTDGGRHPQNVFRLLTQRTWENAIQEARILILAVNSSKSPNRNESNGVFLINRYSEGGADGYYAGIRVDGWAVIKKKKAGEYYVLGAAPLLPLSLEGLDTRSPVAQQKYFAGDLLPKFIWIRLKTIVEDRGGGVFIRFFLDTGSGPREILSAFDDGKSYGGAALQVPGRAGIRTDFIDAEFDWFQISKIF